MASVYHVWLVSQDFVSKLVYPMRFPGGMKKILCCLLAVLPCLWSPCIVQAKAGHLDRSFGNEGRIYTYQTDEATTDSLALAWGGRGKIIVAAHNRLFEFLPDGERNPRFGRGGSVFVPVETWDPLVGLAVDSKRRILVAGKEEGSVFVARFLPDGRPDRSFGNGGRTTAGLGFAAPRSPSPEPGAPNPPSSAAPVIETTGLAVDPTDRPILTGSWVKGYRLCDAESWGEEHAGFVARFDESGRLDPTFDSDGVRVDRDSQEDAAPLLDDRGILLIGAQSDCARSRPLEPVLKRLLPDGTPDEAFGFDGVVDLPFEAAPVLAQDLLNRKILISPSEASFSKLLRLRPDGSQDPGFGENGVDLLANESHLPALGIDSKGRALVVTSEKRSKRGWNFSVRRRLPDGGPDRSFDGDGRVTTRFRGFVSPKQILVGSGGKFVVGAGLAGSAWYGFALARYEGR
jgi:uncharacterized delta-60 repeat protein